MKYCLLTDSHLFTVSHRRHHWLTRTRLDRLDVQQPVLGVPGGARGRHVSRLEGEGHRQVGVR